MKFLFFTYLMNLLKVDLTSVSNYTSLGIHGNNERVGVRDLRRQFNSI